MSEDEVKVLVTIPECKICYESFKTSTPSTLSCGHTFCIKCLRSMSIPNCPTCRQSFDSPKPNYELAEIFKGEQQPSPIVEKEQLNELQTHAYNLMKRRKNIFLTGSPGCGKSYVIKSFYRNFCTKYHIGLTITTGVSSLLIGGKTLHSFLGIQLGKESVAKLYSRIMRNPSCLLRWQYLDILIIDEISMLSPELFDKLEELARLIRKDTQPFGGIQLILSGDFLQLPVVNSHELCFEAKSWKKCVTNTVQLVDIIRQSDKTFQKCLNEIRVNNLSQESKELIKQLNNKKLEPKYGIQPTLIMTTNRNIDVINNKKNEELGESEYFDYELDIEINQEYCFESIEQRRKVVENYRKLCNAKDTLSLCVGSQVMLLYNKDQSNGLVNGSRGVVVGFDHDFPVVRFLNGMEQTIGCHTWEFTDENDVWTVRINMIPLKLAWALTVHSCQGQTLDYAHINFENVFEYGQVYVSMSRVKSIEGLSIKNLNLTDIMAHPKALSFYKNLE